MKKTGVIIAGILILFLVGIFSVSISTGSFFFTTKYFRTPLQAYNDFGGDFDPIIGNTFAEKELLFVPLDEKNGLFVGEVDKNRFVVCEIAIKNGKYASKGWSGVYDIDATYYDLDESIDGWNKTSVTDGSVYWLIADEQEETETPYVKSAEAFTHSSGKTFYLVFYKQ